MSKKAWIINTLLCVIAIILSVFSIVSIYCKNDREAEKAEDQGDIQYVLYVGTNDKDTNQPVCTPDEAMETAKEILIDRFGGYTIQEAHGGWIDGDTEYQEYTLVIHLSDTTPDDVHKTCDVFIDRFNQSSILIQENKIVTEFYAGE